MLIYPHLGGWVDVTGCGQNPQKTNFRPTFLPFRGPPWVRPGTESSSTLWPHLLSQPNTTVATNKHHCQPTPLTHHLWNPLLPITTPNHHWCHPPPVSTAEPLSMGGDSGELQQWGALVVGGKVKKLQKIFNGVWAVLDMLCWLIHSFIDLKK